MSEEKEYGTIQNIFEWIKENYLKVLIVLLLISSLFVSSFLWSNYKDQRSQEAAIIYEQFNSSIDSTDSDLSQSLK